MGDIVSHWTEHQAEDWVCGNTLEGLEHPNQLWDKNWFQWCFYHFYRKAWWDTSELSNRRWTCSDGWTYTTQYLAPQRCIAYHSYRIPVSALFRLESGSLYSNIWLYTAGYCSLNAFSAFSEAPVIDSSNWYGKCQGIYISHCPAQSYPYLFISLPRRIGGFF